MGAVRETGVTWKVLSMGTVADAWVGATGDVRGALGVKRGQGRERGVTSVAVW